MGGKCYRYIKFKKANANVEIDESAKSSYTQLIAIMLQEVSKWYTTQGIELGVDFKPRTFYYS